MSLLPEEPNIREQPETKFRNIFKNCLVRVTSIFAIPVAVSGGAAVGIGVAPEGWELLGAAIGGAVPALGSIVLLWADYKHSQNLNDS